MEFDPVGSAESIPDMIKNDTLIEVLDQDQLSECLKNITLNVDDSLYILNNVQPKYNVSDRFKAVRHIFTDFGEGDKFESKKFVEFIRVLGRCLHIDIHDSIAAIIESTFSKNEQLKIKSDKYDSLVSNPMDQSGLLNEIFNQWIKNERDSFSKQKDEIQAELQTKNIKLAALEVKINELNQENSKLMKQLDDNRSRLEVKDQMIQNIQDKHDKEKKKNEELSAKIQSLEKKYKELLANNKQERFNNDQEEKIDRQKNSHAKNLTRGKSSTSSTEDQKSTRNPTRETYSTRYGGNYGSWYGNYSAGYGSISPYYTGNPTRETSSPISTGVQTAETSSTSVTRNPTRETYSTSYGGNSGSWYGNYSAGYGPISSYYTRNPTRETSSTISTEDQTTETSSTSSTGDQTAETSSTKPTRIPARAKPSTKSTRNPTAETSSTNVTRNPTRETYSTRYGGNYGSWYGYY